MPTTGQGGTAAQAAGPLYFDGTAECAVDGTWERHGHGTEIVTGLHYAPCNVVISSAEITGSITLVAEGTITVTGARLALGPAFADDLLLYSNAQGNNAIKIAGNGSALDGFVYSPRGDANLTGSGHVLRCGILADRIAIKGSTHSIAGDPTCGAPASNAAPVAVDDEYSTDEDVELVVAAPGVLGNDTDDDGDALTAVLVDDVTDGLLALASDGSFTYQPDPNFNGEDSFTYRANDGQADSNLATVTITVNPINDPPVADPNGPYSGSAGSELSFDGLGSFDLDGTIVSYDWDFGDSTTGTGSTLSHAYAASGLYPVALTVTDDGGLTDTASTTADIGPASNAAPVAVDDEASTDEDVALVVAAPGVLGNDTDDDGDALTALLVDDVTDGLLALASDGSFTYQPDPNFNGEDSFTYRGQRRPGRFEPRHRDHHRQPDQRPTRCGSERPLFGVGGERGVVRWVGLVRSGRDDRVL